MNTKKPSPLRTLRVAALGLMSIVASFAIGIHTAGDVRPVASLQAESPELSGDMNADGTVNLADVVVILELIDDNTTASAYQLKVDPIRDGRLTIADALRLLQDLAVQP